MVRDKTISLAEIHQDLSGITSTTGDLIELILATLVSLKLSLMGDDIPVWMLIVGVPSSDKTNEISLVKDTPCVYFLDSLTENSFISGYIHPKAKTKEVKDLLAEVNKKCLVIKDMTTLFSLREETVRKVLGDLQSIYDCEFSKFTGTRGLVKYPCHIALLGAITPSALANHHRYIQAIGSRFLSYRLPRLSEEQRQRGFDILRSLKDKKEKLARLRGKVSAYVEEITSREITLGNCTEDQEQTLRVFAELLSRGRSVVHGSMREFESDEGKFVKYYDVDDVQTEEPWRAFQQLRTLAGGIAVVHGRQKIAEHDLELVRRVVLSSMPVDRAEVISLFQNEKLLKSFSYWEGRDGATVEATGLTRNVCAEAIEKSYGRAAQILTELVKINVLEKRQEGSNERGEHFYIPKLEFDQLLRKPIEDLDHRQDLINMGITQNSPEGSVIS